MNIKPLIIALLLTPSPLAHAGLLEQIRKHPYITAVAGATVLSAVVIYRFSSDKSDYNHQDLSLRVDTTPSLPALESDNHSPVPTMPEAASTFYSIEKEDNGAALHPNGLAVYRTAMQNPSRILPSTTIQESALVAKTNTLHRFDPSSIPTTSHDRTKQAGKSCLKKKQLSSENF